MEVTVEAGNVGEAAWLDDDGRPQCVDMFWMASAHIITAVVGFGPGCHAALRLRHLLYGHAGDPETGKRNYTYMDIVRSNLDGEKVAFCGVIQYANLVGVAIGYTIASSISMKVIRRARCFHTHGHAEPCSSSSIPYMIVFGAV
ncbi:amino acid permease 3-like [Miscanthus floridulus]|uniref:amino acid permease 3-like n=1 Tax=Miscanthus floridulus TaxID=154761 RepID=UPI0034578466